MAKQLARELIGAGTHFGHGVSRWNPKMAPYIFANRGKIHVIDIKKTLAGILIAKKLLVNIVSSGKDVIFVGTKRQAQKTVEHIAEKCGMHYVAERWLGGMLTNFRTVRSRLQRLEELEAMQENGTLESESKKQASRLKREMKKITANLGGVRKMSRLPGLVIVVDASKEYLALREARKLGIATIGIIDTDSDPDTLDVAIPANDDSIRAIELILKELSDAVSIGKTMVTAVSDAPKRTRSKRATLARADETGGETAPATPVAPTTPVTPPAAAPAVDEKPADAEKPAAEAEPAAAVTTENETSEKPDQSETQS